VGGALLAAGLLAFSGETAAAAPIDTASARVGLRAYQRYLGAAVAEMPASTQADDAFVSSVSTTCPNVLAAVNLLPSNSTNSGAAVALGEEAGADLLLDSNVPDRAPFATLMRSVSKLRWSKRGLAAKVEGSLVAQNRYFQLAPSDLCGDASAYASSNAQVTPPGTLTFLAEFNRVSNAPGLSGLSTVLLRFETPADSGVVNDITRLQNKLVSGGQVLYQSASTKLVSVLGLTG